MLALTLLDRFTHAPVRRAFATAGIEIGLDDVADKIATGFHRCRFGAYDLFHGRRLNSHRGRAKPQRAAAHVAEGAGTRGVSPGSAVGIGPLSWKALVMG